MCEDYNSPQSPYWCLKSLIVVALSPDNVFWTCHEEPYPKEAMTIQSVRPPRQILCNHPDGNHHFLLSAAQFVAWPMKNTQAKYCKFAYSSAFGFSVSTGPGHFIEQMAPDSILTLSRDSKETWASKWKWCEKDDQTSDGDAVVADAHFNPLTNMSVHKMERIEWWPWTDRSVSVQTDLFPPEGRWPDWHTRIHKLQINKASESGRSVTAGPFSTVEGGFAIFGCNTTDGRALPRLDSIPDDAEIGIAEGVFQTQDSILILSTAGASGIVTLSAGPPWPSCSALKPDSNSNLMCQKTLIPIIAYDGIVLGASRNHIRLVSMVFAISAEANGGRKITGRTLKERWLDRPTR
jgi:hypothetical protein